ncbi:MAG: hypothetical protein R8K49_03290 [Mariprofundaceae bacterium]
MSWNSAKYKQKTMTFSKSVLMLFVLQLFLSAACISTANASSMQISPASVSAAAHCHEYMKNMDESHHKMSVCGHCDSSDMGLSAQTANQIDMIPVLLAIIDLPEMLILSGAYVSSLIDQNISQHHFSNLYQTTQRILI